MSRKAKQPTLCVEHLDERVLPSRLIAPQAATAAAHIQWWNHRYTPTPTPKPTPTPTPVTTLPPPIAGLWTDLGELHRDLSYLMMGKGAWVAGADRGEAPGPKPEHLGRRLRLRHQPPRSWQLLNGGDQRGVSIVA